MLNNEKICLLGLKFSVLWESTEHKSYQTIPGIRPSGCICLKSRAKWSGRAQTARCQLRRMPALERPLSCGGVCAQLQRAVKGLPLNWSCKFPIFSLLRIESAFATLLLLYVGNLLFFCLKVVAERDEGEFCHFRYKEPHPVFRYFYWRILRTRIKNSGSITSPNWKGCWKGKWASS